MTRIECAQLCRLGDIDHGRPYHVFVRMKSKDFADMLHTEFAEWSRYRANLMSGGFDGTGFVYVDMP